MAFPFYPAGAITAALVLGATLVLFRLLLLALDRGAAELRGSIGPGLVRGVRAWAEGRESPARDTASASPMGAVSPGDPALPAGGIEELLASPGIALEHVGGRAR